MAQGPKYGLYKGIVEDNNDPTGCNQLKVRIGQFWGSSIKGIPTESLPWAKPASPLLTDPPIPIGTVVYVMFEEGDINDPVYIGYMLKNKSNSQCYNCRWFLGGNICKSFPQGIPDEILTNKLHHITIYNLDNMDTELLYTPKDNDVENNENEEFIEVTNADGPEVIELEDTSSTPISPPIYEVQ